MGTLFEDLKEGLRQAIDHTKGKGQARVTVCKTDPETGYEKEIISQVRTEAHSLPPEERIQESSVISAE